MLNHYFINIILWGATLVLTAFVVDSVSMGVDDRVHTKNSYHTLIGETPVIDLASRLGRGERKLRNAA